MYRVEVMSYMNAFNYVYMNSGLPNKEKYAIISIQEPTNGYGLGLEYKCGGNCLAALNIEFADVSRPSDIGLMTTEDAQKIKDFVDGLSDKVEKLIVHCHAGVSRSAAVAAAILFVKTGSDRQIFDSGVHVPNMWVYRKVLKVYGYSNNYEDIQ